MELTWEQLLALFALLAGGATPYFFVLWTWFDFWRQHMALTYTMFTGTFTVIGVALLAFRDHTFAGRLDVPILVQAIGWVVIAAVTVFGWVADRQIGFRVRSFMPFFQDNARIQLRTTGAYGVVRHPIYAAGIGFLFGVFLVTGYPSVLIALAVFWLGALWFTRQEEIRLIGLLDDPLAYGRYRERVPALIPRPTRKTSASQT